MTSRAGTLHLVPTPIGNLRDITLRAIDVLRACDHIVAEDTRRTRKLLSHLELDTTRLSRLDAHASDHDLDRVVRWLLDGSDVALVTDAGSPAVSDPGSSLVRAARDHEIEVTALPGASAVPPAVALSGLVDGPFFFLGFLPRTTAARARAVHDLATRPEPAVLFESPQRTTSTLTEMAEAMPERAAAVVRELTKVHEEVVLGTLDELAKREQKWRGEITLVLGPWIPETTELPSDDDVDERIDRALSEGLHTRTIADRVAAWSARPRRQVYVRVLERKSRMRTRR